MSYRVDGRPIGVRRRNNLQQAHVARRIEEVSAKPRTSELVGDALRDSSYGQSAGIGGDDGTGLANGFDLAKQRPLDVQILHDSFNDPVDFSQLLQIVVKVADGDEAR